MSSVACVMQINYYIVENENNNKSFLTYRYNARHQTSTSSVPHRRRRLLVTLRHIIDNDLLNHVFFCIVSE